MDSKFIKKLVAQVKCGVCGQQYRLSNIRILGNRDDLWFLYVLCSSCHSKGLIAIGIKEDRPLRIVTDLTEPEYAKFREGKGIVADDVLDIHSFLKDFDGDFATELGVSGFVDFAHAAGTEKRHYLVCPEFCTVC